MTNKPISNAALRRQLAFARQHMTNPVTPTARAWTEVQNRLDQGFNDALEAIFAHPRQLCDTLGAESWEETSELAKHWAEQFSDEPLVVRLFERIADRAKNETSRW